MTAIWNTALLYTYSTEPQSREAMEPMETSRWYSVQKHLCGIRIGDSKVKVGITSQGG